MAVKDEDTVPEAYAYFWDKETSEGPLKDFLTKVSRPRHALDSRSTIAT